MFWNSFRPPPGMGEAMAAVYRQVFPDSPLQAGWPGPDGYTRLGDRAASGIRETGTFIENIEQWRFDWSAGTAGTNGWPRCRPSAATTGCPRTRLEEILAGIGAVVDAAGGQFTMGYTTVVTTVLRPMAEAVPGLRTGTDRTTA